MKFVDEYRKFSIIKLISEKIYSECSRDWAIMEVCGGQTHTIMKYGLEELLPESIRILHGPGCPVCVTPAEIIDKAISLALRDNIILATYGDMVRVPGTERDLMYAKAEGADVRIIYSPLEAVKIAEKEKVKQVVLFAIGFETTAPANGQTVVYAKKKNIKNYFLLSSHMLILPALEKILGAQGCAVQGLLAPGHVCTITGYGGFVRLSEKYQLPVSVTGFEPADILQGILFTVEMLEKNRCEVVNQYSRSVKQKGNYISQKIIEDVFETEDKEWRGIGKVLKSGLSLKEEYSAFNAEKVFDIRVFSENKRKQINKDKCMAGEILQGQKKPNECRAFGSLCTPLNPLGAPMVSSEGACAAYYKYKKCETSEIKAK